MLGAENSGGAGCSGSNFASYALIKDDTGERHNDRHLDASESDKAVVIGGSEIGV